ncbi:MAG: pyridoxal-phosphate dependent enzyme, partial [Rhodospirillales bacterium]|nr:pyridoxal-phosphate dependent enzyme [Rhodospirillales bacterium]
PVGAPTLKDSVAAGELITVPKIETAANTLAPRRSADLNLAIIQENVDEIVLVTDDEMRKAAQWLWFEMGIGAELSGAAALAVIKNRKIELASDAVVGAIICGAGTDGF